MNITTARSKVDFNQQIAQLSGEQRAEKIIHLHQEVVNLNQEVVNRDRKIQELEEQLAWFKRQIFGKRSERDVSNLNSQQLEFEGFEKLVMLKRKKRKRKSSLMSAVSLIETVRIKLLFLPTFQLKQQSLIFLKKKKYAPKRAKP